jgi:hypothetical protein
MTKFFYTLLFVLLSAQGAFAASADSGWTVGNGGNPIALDFLQNARAAVAATQKDPVDYPQLQNVNLDSLLENADILVSATPIYVKKNGIEQRVAAENFPDSDSIWIDQDFWTELNDTAIKQALALHEVLGLAGLEETGQYPISQKYLSSLGVNCTRDLCVPQELAGNPVLCSSASSASYLVGSEDSSEADLDLSQEGTTDWIQWNELTSRKASSSPILPDYSYLQPYQQVNAYVTDARPLSWSDGTPVASATNDRSGYSVTNFENGFSFTVPSDQNVRVVTVHVSEFLSAARLSAEFLDGSSAPYVDLVPLSQAHAGYDRNYRITYSSKNPTRLKISWYATTSGNANLSAAALSLTGQTRSSSTIAGTWDDSTAGADLTKEGTSDWVRWGWGSQMSNRKATGGGQISDFSTPRIYDGKRRFSWTDGANGPESGSSLGSVTLQQMNNGFVLEIPVSGLRQQLAVHGGGFLASGVFTAVLNDGSGCVYVDTVAPSTGDYERSYTLDFNAAHASTMTVMWRMTSSLGAIKLSGVALK